MTGKYESLLPEILPEPSLGNGRYVAGIRDALSWLDDHPDQVPGQSITADAEREIEKIKLDERNKFIDELLKDAENEAWIARMGDDEDRLRVAEYLTDYLNQVDVETGERTL